MRTRKPMCVLGMVLLGSVVVFAQEGLKQGVQAPDFSLPTVAEKNISLKEAVAKGVVVLHFWKSK